MRYQHVHDKREKLNWLILFYTVNLPEEVARNVELFTTDNNNFVSFQKDLSDDCGQAAEQVATAIDNNGLKHKKH